MRVFCISTLLRTLLTVACLLLIFTSPARAVMVADMFNAVVPVTAQTPEEFARGAAVGLEQVLVRLTGRTEVASEPSIKAAMRTADVYLLQFRYEGEGDQGVILNLSFDQPLLEKLLRDAKIPLWPADRVAVAVWVVLEDSTGERVLINSENKPALTAALNAVAQRRGLILNYPLLDLADATRVDPLVVWDDRNAKPILEASERYDSAAVLVGRFTESATGIYAGSWQIADSKGEKSITLAANPWEAQANLGVGLATEMLAARYAIAPVAIAGKGTVIEVTNIKNFAAYNALLQSVKTIAAVRQVVADSIEGDRVVLRIIAEGQLAQLVDALNRISTLQAEAAMNAPAPAAPVADPAGAAPVATPETISGPLRYRWRG